jgi:hypothetical protein
MTPRQNIDKIYQKPFEHPLIVGECLHNEHLCLEPPIKKEKMKKTKSNGMPRTLMPPERQQNSLKGQIQKVS